MYQLAAETSTFPHSPLCMLVSLHSTACGLDYRAGADAVTEKFASAGMLSTLTHKEQLLSPDELAGPCTHTARCGLMAQQGTFHCDRHIVYASMTLCGMVLLAGLTTIQQAAIDFLVILNSPKFVGFSASSFSCFVKFTRLQLGHPLDTNILIGNAGIQHAYQLL
jgi:hypothetical protein